METKYLFHNDENEEKIPAGIPIEPLLFVSIGKEIVEFPLSGRQTVGRSSVESLPDIVIPNYYISREHGYFETEGTSVSYTAEKTTNPTVYRGKTLSEGETVQLLDGDEISIPTGDDSDDSGILMVVATTRLRADIWRKLMEESRDSRTLLGGINSFIIWYAKNISHHSLNDWFLFLMEIDFYDHLKEIRGEDAVDKAVVIAHGAITEITRVTDSIFQLDERTFVGAVNVSEHLAPRLFEAVSDLIINTVIEDSLHITVSISYMELESVPYISMREAEELTEMMRDALENEKKLNMRNCLVKWKE